MQHDVINLQERFGNRYRVTFDAAYHPKGKRVPDPWYMQLPCRFGFIYPVGGDRLAAEVDYHGKIAEKLGRLGLKLRQNGDGEKTFEFHVSQFDAVAGIMKPWKRPKLSEEQEQARRRLLGTFSFPRQRRGA